MKKMTSVLLAMLLVLSLCVTAFATETADSVRSRIEALPTVEEFKAMNAEEQLNAYNQTQAAYDAYMALSGEEKAQLEGAEAIFEALFSHYNTLIAPAESGKESNNRLVWIILPVIAVMVLVPTYRKKKTA